MASEFDSIRPDTSKGDGFAVNVRGTDFAIFSHGNTPMSLFDPSDGRVLEVNDAWVEKYGYSREEAHSMRVQEVSAEPSATSDAVRRAAHTGGAHIDVRWHKNKDGRVFPVELTSGTLRIGERTLMYAVMHDIEARVRAEDRLQQSEARFRALVEHLPLGIVVHRDGRIIYVNPGMRCILGLSEHDAMEGTAVLDMIHPDDRENVSRRVAAVQAGNSTAPEDRRLRRVDGSFARVEVSAIPIEIDGERVVLAMMLDIEARKRMEAQLVLADRLASLGRLAASVGHEINNPLAYLLGNLELLKRDLGRLQSLDPATRATFEARLDVVNEGALRVRDIVRDLKALSSGDAGVGGTVELHHVLDVCLHMAELETRARANVVKQFDKPAFIRTSESRLGQIFLNLLINAAHAIPEGHAAENEIRISTRRLDATHVEVEIRDTGVGISVADRDRIFEPFYTTKASRGTGLGLSISHTIVTALGGTISAERIEPRGSGFRVVLPCDSDADDQPVAEIPSTGRPGTHAASRPRLLVAEDERALARTVSELLDEFEVTQVHGGNAAIASLERQEFDAVLLDLHMSEGSGMDVIEWLESHRPEVRERLVVMTAGAPDDHDGPALATVRILYKPFEAAALRSAIERVLVR